MSIAQCAVDWCKNEQATKYKSEYCSPHYWRAKEGRDMDKPILKRLSGDSLYEKVMNNTVQEGECLVFSSSVKRGGYGYVFYNGVRARAHRVVAEHHYGKSDLHVMHSCDNPPCVNIEHLSYGTAGDNIRDASRKLRMSIGQRNASTRLANKDVMSIYLSSDSQGNLAKKYGVDQTTVWAIKNGKSWSWLTGNDKIK